MTTAEKTLLHPFGLSALSAQTLVRLSAPDDDDVAPPPPRKLMLARKDLCVECFSVGVEIGTHKKEHSYQVMEQLNFPIFAEDWGADEELLLLEAIDMYGIGNWVDCADHVGTKTKDDCETHYFTIYFESPTAPLPVCGIDYVAVC